MIVYVDVIVIVSVIVHVDVIVIVIVHVDVIVIVIVIVYVDVIVSVHVDVIVSVIVYVIVVVYVITISGRRRQYSVACSKACPICNTPQSSRMRPTICSPIGKPASVKPAGTERAGLPNTEM